MTIPLTGTQYEIEAGDYRATVTELGAGLRTLEHRGTPLVTSYDADQLPPHGAGQLLSPWPNRVDGGRYSFDGAEYHLALSEPARGNAIHGLTRWAPWTRTGHDRGEVTLRSVPHGQQGYPFAVQVDVTYRLDAETGLHVSVTATNKGSRPAPWGTGPASVPDHGDADGRRLRADPARRRAGCPSTSAASRPAPRRTWPGPSSTSARRASSATPGSTTRSPACTASRTAWPGSGCRRAASAPRCGRTRATAGCRSSPATRWSPSIAAPRWPSNR